MTITCHYELWGPDMYPEFAPEPICYERCDRPATHLVVSTWGHEDPVCAEHSTEADAAETTVVRLEPEYARGWLFGQAEALSVELTEHDASLLCNEDALPEQFTPRSAISGEWAGESLNELGLTDETAETYQHGYEQGWTSQLYLTAAQVYRANES